MIRARLKAGLTDIESEPRRGDIGLLARAIVRLRACNSEYVRAEEENGREYVHDLNGDFSFPILLRSAIRLTLRRRPSVQAIFEFCEVERGMDGW